MGISQVDRQFVNPGKWNQVRRKVARTRPSGDGAVPSGDGAVPSGDGSWYFACVYRRCVRVALVGPAVASPSPCV